MMVLIGWMAIASGQFYSSEAGSTRNRQLPVTTGKAQAEINVWVAKNVAPASKIQLNINTRNVPIVHVRAFPLNGISWLRLPEHKRNRRPIPIGPAFRQFDLTIASKSQVLNPRDNYFSRQVNLPPMPSGVFLLTLSSGAKEAWAVVNVSNLCTSVHRSPTQTLVWVTSYKSGRVVTNAQVQYFDELGRLVRSSKTGADGAAMLATPQGSGTVVIQSKSDIAGVETQGRNPDGHLKCLFQTDRPIYRPGQTVSFKALLRLTHGQGYERVANVPVTVELRDPKDNPLDEVHVQASDMGSVFGVFQLPE